MLLQRYARIQHIRRRTDIPLVELLWDNIRRRSLPAEAIEMKISHIFSFWAKPAVLKH